MKPICVIPIRSGSKGLSNKNMLFLEEKPMVFHTIDAAVESNLFDLKNIYISTDSKEYADICQTKGVSVLLREEALASDTATSYDVLSDFLNRFEDEQPFVLLQATSPLRTGVQIQEAYSLFMNKAAENVVSISKVDKHPRLFTTLGTQDELVDIVGVDKNYRRQNEKQLYYPNGAIFISTKSAYLSNQSFFTEKTIGYQMDKSTAIDIDDALDFKNVIAQRFFDYALREVNNKKLYALGYQQLKDEQATHIILGDSRMLAISMPPFANYAQGGVTLHTLLSNLENLLTSSVTHAFISIGINDLKASRTVKQIIDDFTKLFDCLEARHIKLFITTIPYTLFRESINNRDVKQINEWLRNETTKRHLPILDVNTWLSENDHLKYGYTTDGLHFTDDATKLLEETYKTFYETHEFV
ncbi:acylneuraminate cytidylyltransferase [Carnobacteriaceae bacterium zg-ZUI240]|nr:acylneuraminate cytidylyltransferase [Carnobacteriaceae bacterium zg-ZUI240]